MNDPANCMPTIGVSMKGPVPSIQDRFAFREVRGPLRRKKVKFEEGKIKYCNDHIGSNRWDITLGPASYKNKQAFLHHGWYANQTDREDRTHKSSGNLSSHTYNWEPTSYSQDARTTVKETTEFSYEGDPMGRVQVTKNLWEDDPRVTIKETTAFSYEGDPMGRVEVTKNMWDDDPRVTIKETTEFSYEGGAGRSGLDKNMERFNYEQGMQSNGIRQAANVVNHFSGAYSSNRLPDPYTKDGRKVSSVGRQFNKGLKQSSNYDALERSNVQAGGGVQFKNHDSKQIGTVFTSPNKLGANINQRFDYTLFDAVKSNPLSAYRTSNDSQVPKFFCQTKPEDFSPKREETDNQYLSNSQQLGKQGNAQVTILGLNKPNPLLDQPLGNNNNRGQFCYGT
tara:strand:+ start:4430 stop:5614 length:1185 start_codon:yes stop_codon:yes gene_type:complete